jgi:hypothetical protein
MDPDGHVAPQGRRFWATKDIGTGTVWLRRFTLSSGCSSYSFATDRSNCEVCCPGLAVTLTRSKVASKGTSRLPASDPRPPFHMEATDR